MKAVMISIQPKWCAKIASGEKTIEVRKTKPNITTPFKCYIYCTKGDPSDPHQRLETHSDGKVHLCNGKVIGEFVCNRIILTATWRLRGETVKCAKRTEIETQFPTLSCLTIDEIREYAGSNQRIIYCWLISDLVIYEKPKELAEFTPHCRYMDDDMCDYRKVACNYQAFDHNPWPDCSVNDVTCKKRMRRPPQSWCYVEELIDNA